MQEISELIGKWRNGKKLMEDAKCDLAQRVANVFALEEMILERLSMEGYDNVKHDGETLYKMEVRSVTKADGVGVDQLTKALNGSEFDYLLKPSYHASSLKGAVLERIDSGEPLPEELEGLIKISEFVKLGCRKS